MSLNTGNPDAGLIERFRALEQQVKQLQRTAGPGLDYRYLRCRTKNGTPSDADYGVVIGQPEPNPPVPAVGTIVIDTSAASKLWVRYSAHTLSVAPPYPPLVTALGTWRSCNLV
jgi:hypothetical protein